MYVVVALALVNQEAPLNDGKIPRPEPFLFWDSWYFMLLLLQPLKFKFIFFQL